jgi:hypothetical protein
MSAEKRKNTRKDMQLKGLILDVDGAIVSLCVVVNVSHTGARLLCKAPNGVPDSFILLLSKNNGVRRVCDVVWRAGKKIGVRFLQQSAADPATASFVDDALARIGVNG